MKLFHTILFILVITFAVSAQNNVEGLKKEAISQMQNGRYGEAIDLLNKYCSAKPQNAEGFNLRGLCYEKRGQYEYSVYDLRLARKLDPGNGEISKNLDRVTTTWYALLNDKIAGHKREIAINPNIAVNYLEIGKCHKHMGHWETAEEWYDQYLKREEPSADEVIRYCEILTKTKHIEKGEKILKRFVEKYPTDHRLWSRYGYFTMWLGKRKIAIDAFKKALALRPYFKEAMDGLDQAEGKDYTYTIFDTTGRTTKDKLEKEKPQEYIIDRYFRIVKNNPGDTTTRLALVEELIKVNRFEEAYQQLQILTKTNQGTPRFSALWDSVTSFRDRFYEEQLLKYKDRFEKDPSDKEAAIRVAESHARLLNYEEGINTLKKYLEANPDDEEILFLIARYSAWNYQFEDAISFLQVLLNKKPDNLEYKLLRAQVAVWTTQDTTLARDYLKEVLSNEPNSIQALIGLATLYIRDRDFMTAKDYIEKAKQLDPKSKEIETIQNFYDVSLSLEADRKIFEILVEGRNLAQAQDCPGALVKYDEYFSKITAPNRIELMEYADVNSCAGNYRKAIEIYEKMLEGEYDFDIALLRAKNYLWAGDSLFANQELDKLVKEDSSSFDAKLYLAESYERLQKYSEAKNLYEYLVANAPDSSKRRIAELRIGWLPKGGGGLLDLSFLENFPTYIRIAPQGQYYHDNQNFSYTTGNVNIEAGILSFLSVYTTFGRTVLGAPDDGGVPALTKTFTTFKYGLILQPFQFLYLTYGKGRLSSLAPAVVKSDITEWSIRTFFGKKAALSLTYENNDAAVILYSKRLIEPFYWGSASRYRGNAYRFNGSYQFGSAIKANLYYSYITLSDGNAGNDIQFRLGRNFEYKITGGYEYLYANYARNSIYYYTPQNFTGHAIWAEYVAYEENNLTLTIGGKLGYIPDSDFIIREISGQSIYELTNSFFISARIAVGGSFHEATQYAGASSYEFLSGTLLLYYTF